MLVKRSETYEAIRYGNGFVFASHGQGSGGGVFAMPVGFDPRVQSAFVAMVSNVLTLLRIRIL